MLATGRGGIAPRAPPRAPGHLGLEVRNLQAVCARLESMGGRFDIPFQQGPDGGSIASLVRSTADGASNMIELIVIEETDDSLMLRLKQWNPGMEPRAEGFQVMELIEIGDRKVVFRNVGDTGLQQLGYSLDGDRFTISISTGQGSFDIPLTRQPH